MRVGAFREEGEVFVADFGDFEQAALCADIRCLDGPDIVDDGCSGCACDTVVVCLADTADGSNIGLNKVMLGEICELVRVISLVYLK